MDNFPDHQSYDTREGLIQGRAEQRGDEAHIDRIPQDMMQRPNRDLRHLLRIKQARSARSGSEDKGQGRERGRTSQEWIRKVNKPTLKPSSPTLIREDHKRRERQEETKSGDYRRAWKRRQGREQKDEDSRENNNWNQSGRRDPREETIRNKYQVREEETGRKRKTESREEEKRKKLKSITTNLNSTRFQVDSLSVRGMTRANALEEKKEHRVSSESKTKRNDNQPKNDLDRKEPRSEKDDAAGNNEGLNETDSENNRLVENLKPPSGQ